MSLLNLIVPASTEQAAKKARLKYRKKFLYYFPKGFMDQKYLDWERSYKSEAHEAFNTALDKKQFKDLLSKRRYEEIAAIAVRIESRTNLLFSFEKMALRDAVKSKDGAKAFATGLFDYLYGKGHMEKRFGRYAETIASLPRKQTRVLTWPLLTVFGFLGNPEEHIFLKPRVTQEAAKKYRFDFQYKSKPNWNSYQSVLAFADQVKKDVKDLKPRDYIDLQSYIWVIGSDEYPE